MMAPATAFPCQKPPSQIFSSHQVALITNVSPTTFRRRNLLLPRGMGVPKEHTLGTKSSKPCLLNNHRKLNLIATLAANTDSGSEETSLSETVENFYTCINEKNLKQLGVFISKDCTLEDSAFPYEFQGRQEVVSFFGQLAESMGRNVQFRIGHVCEGDELTASVNWHLEWKEDQIPSSRGCSIFQFSKDGDKLVIRKAQIITESPIKPGKLATALLKIVTSIFDDYPKAAKWFLKSPHTILKAVLNIYNLFVAPVVNPVLSCYINLWKFIARLLGYLISIMHGVARLLNRGSSKDDPNTSTSDDQGILQD